MMKKKLLPLFLFLTISHLFFAQSIEIGGTNYPTLQDAVSNAVTGDLINVSGTITESAEIVIDKNLTIRGDGATTTTLQPSSTTPDANSVPTHTNINNGFITINNSAVVTIENLTINNVKHEDVNNNRKSKGALTFVSNAEITLKNVIVEDCWTNGPGGAIYAQNMTSVSLENCVLRNNHADNSGGAMFVQNNSVSTTKSFSIKNCLFENNFATTIGGKGGALGMATKDHTAILNGEITRSTFLGNDGSKSMEAIYFNGEGLNVNLYNNTIAYNATGWALYFAKTPQAVDMSNNIIMNNDVDNDIEKDHTIVTDLSWLTFSNNIVENIGAEFASLDIPENNSYFNVNLTQIGIEDALNSDNYLDLLNTSLAINSGKTIAGVTDGFMSTAPDMGAKESEFTEVATSTSIILNPLFNDNMVFQQNITAPIWGTGNAGETINIVCSWGANASTVVGEDGKWSAVVETPVATPGQTVSYTVTISDDGGDVVLNNVLVGEVWICSGQSNMVMPMSPEYDKDGNITTVGCNNYETEIANANYDNIRFFYVKGKISDTPLETVTGTWKPVTSTTVVEEHEKLSAVAYFFARELQKDEYLNIPIGLIQAAVGATGAQIWTSREALSADADLKAFYLDESDYQSSLENGHPDKTYKGGSYSTKRYNGMIHPLVPFAIKGAIWYQGENNRYEYDRYTNLLSTMMTDWRSLWNIGNFPFYYVEIAPWTNISLNQEYANSGLVISALQREAMAEVQNVVPNAALVTALDLGEKSDIHPPHKQEVGLRLALMALKKTYGFDLVYTGPKLTSYNIENDKIRLYFEEDGIGSGLVADGGDLNHFKIAGADDVYYEATAIIDGNTVLVSSPSVPNPENVTYGFDNALDPAPTFKNAEGIAAFPFRTINIGAPSLPTSIEYTDDNTVVINQISNGFEIKSTESIKSINVFNINGQLVLNKPSVGSNKVFLNTEEFGKGIFFISAITVNDYTFTGKVIN
ncbi:hypothetical protein E9993_16195 [Labilibacter sediminis]|nr:hypothetical protein E9993_16195 [Labilibacter sediminis]